MFFSFAKQMYRGKFRVKTTSSEKLDASNDRSINKMKSWKAEQRKYVAWCWSVVMELSFLGPTAILRSNVCVNFYWIDLNLLRNIWHIIVTSCNSIDDLYFKNLSNIPLKTFQWLFFIDVIQDSPRTSLGLPVETKNHFTRTILPLAGPPFGFTLYKQLV